MDPLLHKNRKLTSFQLIILGFSAVIPLGTLLLMLPNSRRAGVGATFGDALFTATSVVCVTGLVVHDTATYWSGFGQAVLLVLIQIGGMGVITVAVSFAIISGRKISLMQRSTMQEAISASKVGGIVRLTGFIIRTALCTELLGAAVMAVDSAEERVEAVLPYVTNAQIGDSTNAAFMESLGVRNYDVCIVTVATDFQCSPETTALLRELGAKLIVSRAKSDVQEKFLLKRGGVHIRRAGDLGDHRQQAVRAALLAGQRAGVQLFLHQPALHVQFLRPAVSGDLCHHVQDGAADGLTGHAAQGERPTVCAIW